VDDNIVTAVKAHILEKYLPGEDPSRLGTDTELIRSGILDSLATLDLVAFLEDRYGVEFEAHEVEPTRLATLADIEKLVKGKLEA
jgi:acyl carrier protein